jgi:NADPH-dependent curcumin reductase CurA
VPDGASVFFDNVGGSLLDEMLLHMVPGGRVVSCGAVSQYGLPVGEQHRFATVSELLKRNMSMQPSWMSDDNDQLPAHFGELATLLAGGQSHARPAHVLDGIEAVPTGLGMLLDGSNIGKLVVRLSGD